MNAEDRRFVLFLQVRQYFKENTYTEYSFCYSLFVKEMHLYMLTSLTFPIFCWKSESFSVRHTGFNMPSCCTSSSGKDSI